MPNSPFKNLRIKPLTGPLNPVASADELPPGVFAWKEHFEISKSNRLARRAGWEEFLDGRGGAPLSDVNHLDEVVTPDGVRRLVAGRTDSTVHLLSSAGTSWTDLGGTFTGTDWTSDALGNVIAVSDGTGEVHQLSVPSSSSLTPIGSLSNLQVAGVKIIVQFAGCLFLMNLVEGGFRQTSRIRWCGLNTPLEWEETESSIAGFQDLPYGQKILNAGVLGDRLLIYTDSAAWAVRATGGEGVFGFTQLYSDPVARSRCLTHPRSLVNIGSAHVYLGQDGIYTFSAYQREPIRLEWMDAAARLLFEPGTSYTLSRSSCDTVSGFNSETQEIWLSWRGADNDYTLVADTRFKTCDLVREGWTAFVSHGRRDEQSFGDWLDTYIPDNSTLWFDDANPNYLALCGKRTDAFCSGCDDNPLFVGATRSDVALKTIASRLDGTRISGRSVEGSTEGYTSVLRGVIPAIEDDNDKVLRRMVVDVLTDAVRYGDDSFNAFLQLRTGVSNQAFNPNDLGSNFDGIQWTTHVRKVLGPDTSGDSMDVVESKNLLRTLPVEWNLHERGRFIYWELSVTGQTGGPVVLDRLELSRLEFEIRTVNHK
jgi:hypothetical protein